MDDKLKESIKILNESEEQLAELTNVALEVYTSYANDATKLNQITLYSVYGFLIIRACVFYDELTGQFEKLNQNISDAELNKEYRLLLI
jgi:hypothetical protein